MLELSRKELVRPIRRSSMASETEYTFLHVLARDVAYAQLPRAARASRHVAAAAWIESKVPERLDDLADVLADGYVDAAARWASLGSPEHGFAPLGQCRCLLELSRPSELAEVLRQAREILLHCGMRPALEETDAVLARTTALTS